MHQKKIIKKKKIKKKKQAVFYLQHGYPGIDASYNSEIAEKTQPGPGSERALGSKARLALGSLSRPL